jgi:NADPH2:quinone reductase
MKAIRVHAAGEADQLQLEEIDRPEPGPGEALVRIAYAGINFVDIYQRRGWYRQPPPFTPGLEAAGVVAAVGPNVTVVSVGDRVAYSGSIGSYAEMNLVPAEKLVPVPDGLELPVAAATMLQGMTAHYLTHSTFPLTAGHTVLVHAAAGGVGQILVQLARMRDALVIGTVSTDEKAALALEAGADVVIRYTEMDFLEETMRLTEDAGVDVVYDSVGKDTFDRSLDCLRPRGTMVLYGQASGPVPLFDLQRLNQKGSLFITRPSLGHYTATRQELMDRAGDLFRWIADGDLTIRIDHVFPLAEAAEAHRYMEARRTKGKVLLEVDSG